MSQDNPESGNSTQPVVWSTTTADDAQRGSGISPPAAHAFLDRAALYHAVIETSTDGFWIIDRQGRIREVNPAYVRQSGYDRDKLLGMHVADLDAMENPGDVSSHLEKIERQGNDIFETLHRAKDGTIWPVEVNASFSPMENGLFFVHLRNISERKRTENALAASETRFRKIFEQAAVGMVVADENRTILNVNPSFLDMLGYRLDELVGRHLSEISVAEDETTNLRIVEETRARGGDTFSMEKRYRGKDGRVIHGQLDVTLLPPAPGADEAFIGIIQDISGRKRMEQSLKESENLYRNLVETTSAVAWEVDCATLRFDYISPQIERISGYPAWQWTDFSFWVSKIHPEDRETAVNFCQAETSKGLDHSFAYRMFTADGRVLWIRDVVSVIKENGRPVKLRGYFIDITAAQEAEEKIRASEQFIRGIHDSMDDGLIVVDRHFRIMSANRAFCDMNNLSSDQVIGRYCFEISHKRNRPCHECGEDCPVTHVFRTGEPHSTLHKHEDGAGGLLYVETKGFPLLDGSGNITGAIEVIHNITERYLLEAEQLKSQKLEAIGTLAGGIAHDFNNLLQGVFGYVSMAMHAIDHPEKAARMLEQAEKALSLSVNLTNQLLTFAKGGKPVKKIADLRPVIENATKFALSGSRCDFRARLAANLWPAEVDEGQIAQVVQNVVLNASEAMPEGGTVELAAANIELAEKARPNLPAGHYLQITIKDSGIGIPEAWIARIFDPYFTTKQKGSGLGLATSYSIVKNHGGNIEVASEQGKGSTFTILLPACAAAGAGAANAALAQRGGEQATPARRRILVMDDEDLVRNVAEKMLELLGNEVETARHGQEALAKYRAALAAGRPFDLVILDLTIKGGMGGEETIKQLLALDPGVRAAVSSGYSEAPVVSSFRAYGFIGILNKPYTTGKLREFLESL